MKFAGASIRGAASIAVEAASPNIRTLYASCVLEQTPRLKIPRAGTSGTRYRRANRRIDEVTMIENPADPQPGKREAGERLIRNFVGSRRRWPPSSDTVSSLKIQDSRVSLSLPGPRRARVEGEIVGTRRRAGRRTRRKIDLILLRAHLKLRLRNVDLAAVDELDDELEVVEADVLRHDDRRVFAGVRQQELLEVGAAGRQHHLGTWKKKKRGVLRRTSTPSIKSRLPIKSRRASGRRKSFFRRSFPFCFCENRRAVLSAARVFSSAGETEYRHFD